MAVKKCKTCGALFDSIGTPFCPECVKEMDYKYKVVRDYLYDNPDQSVEEVAKATETPEWMIMHFLRDARLTMKNASGLIRCEQCGRAITSGRFCDECAIRLGSKMKGAREAIQSGRAAGPRIYTNDDRRN
ncbi:MAG: MerR family transcriptional regulator [Clostridia bacterium]|nr:MerR family transcriptional regulator [Clostridia bacterium]